MKFFMQRTLGSSTNKDYCFTEDGAEGVSDYKLTVGDLMETYPSDPWKVIVRLGEDHLGLLLPSFIGNVDCLLIVHKEVAEVIQEFNTGEMQVFPFSLINHKDRVHSKDYVFLNPLGTVDCLHLELSDIRRSKNGKIRKVRKFVLDKEKLRDVPDLFRPQEDHSEYIYSERLVEALQNKGFTNFEFEELEQG